MHIYSNLNSDVKRHFWYRSTGAILLAILTIYCSTVMALQLVPKSWLIFITFWSPFYMITNLAIIWHMIYYNEVSVPMYFFDILIGGILIAPLSIYVSQIATQQSPFVIYEFVPMELLMILIFGTLVAFFLIGVWKLLQCCYGLMKDTNKIVQERNKESIPKA